MIEKRGPRLGLQWRVSIALVVIVVIPFTLSYVLLDQIGRTAANLKANESKLAIVPMTKSPDAHRDLFDTPKRLHADIADRPSHRPELSTLDPKTDLDKILDEEAATQAHLRGIALLRDDGSVVTEAQRPLDPHEQARLRDKVVDQPLA